MITEEILSIGEILFDVYPEHKKMGGAPFNFLYHIHKITGKGIFVSAIGNDKLGSEISEILDAKGISQKHVQIKDDYPTGTVNVSLSEDKTPGFEITENVAFDHIAFNPELKNTLSQDIGLIYFGTLAQREQISRNTIQSIWNKKKTTYFYDINLRQHFYSKELLNDCLKQADIVKLNTDELKIVHSFFLDDEYNINTAANAIKNTFSITLLCVTMGSDGAMLVTDNATAHHHHKADKIIDTVGAGDAFSAILSIGYLMGLPLQKINAVASEFAAAICGIEGALPTDDSFYNKYTEELQND